jgi:hypothetical protein
MKRGVLAWSAGLVSLAFASSACGDGGVPILVHTVGGRSWTLMMRPASPSIGPIELDLLGSGGAAALLEMREQDGPWEVLSFEAGADPRVMHARTELESSGPCEFRLRVGGMDAAVEARVEVSERSAVVSMQWLWALAWVPMVLLLWLRSQAVRARLYTAPHG